MESLSSVKIAFSAVSLEESNQKSGLLVLIFLGPHPNLLPLTVELMIPKEISPGVKIIFNVKTMG